MTFRKLAAIVVIFLGASAAWSVLGSSLLARTGQYDQALEHEVQLLWGARHRQVAPSACVQRPRVETETVDEKQPDGRLVRRDTTITIGAILTLFVLMQITARVSWDVVFASSRNLARDGKEDGNASRA